MNAWCATVRVQCSTPLLRLPKPSRPRFEQCVHDDRFPCFRFMMRWLGQESTPNMRLKECVRARRIGKVTTNKGGRVVGELIGFCGVICSRCLCYLATREGNAEGLAEAARAWSETLGRSIRPDECFCDGCLPPGKGRLARYCDECSIRACCLRRNVPNCGHCMDFPCAEIRDFTASGPDKTIMSRLSDVRKKVTSGPHTPN